MDRQVSYIIAVISDFAEHFGLSTPQAYRYLARYKGIDFLQEFYDVETPSLLTIRWLTSPSTEGNNGGVLVWEKTLGLDGAGGILGRLPAPQNGNTRATVAPVVAIFCHLRH